MRRIQKIIHDFDVILLSLVLNANVLRYFLNVQETSLVLYLLYFVCIVVLFIHNKRTISIQWNTFGFHRSMLVFYAYILVYSLLSCLWNPTEFVVSLKFMIEIIIAVLAMFINPSKIGVLFRYIIIINIIYAVSIVVHPDRIDAYMFQGTNYLTMTLSLGMGVTITLLNVVYVFFRRHGHLQLIIWLALSMFFYYVLIGFSARGVLFFPVIVIVVMVYSIGKNNKLKLFIFTSLFFVLIYLSYLYFTENASDLLMNRMIRLFENTEEESRWGIWIKTIDETLNRGWFIIGAGINGFESIFEFYPHNIFLHFLADYGLLVMFYLLWIVVYTFIKFYQINKNGRTMSYNYNMAFAVFLYYLLTFCKSFSVYDALPLLIMIALCVSAAGLYHKSMLNLTKDDSKIVRCPAIR